jgi:hypothetical protein
MIQAMICGLVPTSGAGTSMLGFISGLMSVAKRRVSRSSSVRDSVAGSTITPPFAPP